MARLNQPHATSVEQALQQEIAKLDRKLSTLQRRTTTTLQQAAPASIADPVEGQLIINHADNHRLYWYSNGAWHSVCDCEVANGEIILVGYHGNTASWEDIYKLDPLGPTLTRITNVNQAGTVEYYRAMWGDLARSKIAAVYNQQTGSDRYYELNADGSSPAELYLPTVAPFLTTMTLRLTDADVLYGLYRASASEATLYVANLETDVETTIAASIKTGATEIRVWALSPDGSRVAASFVASGTNHLGSCDRDGSNFIEYYSTTAGVGVQRWKPDGSSVLFYKNGTPHELRVADPNASGSTVVVDTGSNMIFNQAWSPDGTKIAYGRNGLNGIAIVNADGTGLVEIPVTQGIVFDFDWSPDSNYICIANGDDPCIVELVDVAGESASVIFDSSTDGEELYLNTVQWAGRTFYMS